jgi:hypothetical protein
MNLSTTELINQVKEDYDFTDDFIDDSEIAIDDAETHIPRPAKEGFFVHVGPVELMAASVRSSMQIRAMLTNRSPDKPTRKPAGPRKPRPTEEVTSLPSLAEATKGKIKSERSNGASQADPIAIDVDDDAPGLQAGPSTASQRQRKCPTWGRDGVVIAHVCIGSISPARDAMPLVPVEIDMVKYHAAVKDPRVSFSILTLEADLIVQLLPPWPTFPPDVQRALHVMREKSEERERLTAYVKDTTKPSDRWEGAKTKFPPHLKPYLQAAMEAAYQNQLWDDRSETGFNKAMCSALPYNMYTLSVSAMTSPGEHVTDKQKLALKLGHEGYWNFLKRCEDTGLERMAVFVNNEKDKWIAKYEEQLAQWKSETKFP